MLEPKIGQIVHYMNHSNRIMRGKVLAKIGQHYSISGSNFLISKERIFPNDQQVTIFFNKTKGWIKPENPQ